MSLFGSNHKPSAYDSELTVGNICAILTDTKYKSGLDPNTTVNTIIDLYNYFTCNKNLRIRLPAPMSDPNDSYCFMWPEGAKTSSRAPSNSSAMYKGRKFSNYTSEKARNRASSVVSSSKFSTRHVGFTDDGSDNDDINHSNRSHKHSHSHHKSSSERHRHPSDAKSNSNGSNIMRINGQVMKPTTSMEQMFNRPKVHDDEDKEDEDNVEAPRPPALRRQAKFSGFAEDE